MSKAVLGIDVAKKKLDVCLMADGKVLMKKFDNNTQGVKLLGGWLMSLHVERVHVCLEATGTYSELVAEFLHGHGHRVSVVNPFRIKGFANSDLKRNKTDTADARTIAGFCLAKDPEDWHPLLASEQNRLELAAPEVRSSLDRVIGDLRKKIANVQRLIKDHIDNDPDLKQQNELLQTIPGIGEKTARTLLGEIEFRSFSSARALAAFTGLTPESHSPALLLLVACVRH